TSPSPNQSDPPLPSSISGVPVAKANSDSSKTSTPGNPLSPSSSIIPLAQESLCPCPSSPIPSTTVRQLANPNTPINSPSSTSKPSQISPPLQVYHRRTPQSKSMAPHPTVSIGLSGNQEAPPGEPTLSRCPSPPNRIITRSQNNIQKPKQIFDYLAHLETSLVPHTFKQAEKHPEWRKAMKSKFDALPNNHTWELVPNDPSKNVVSCKWLFRIKRKADGSVDRYKARLVAKGFTQRPDDIILSQANYINEILSAELMSDCKSAKTPISNSDLLKLNDGADLTDATRYRRVLDRLQYLSFNRPDISYAVNKLSQFMQSPSDLHWNVVKRVLRYLRGTIQFGLRVSPNCDFNLHMYSDADWAEDLTDRSSTSGYILFLDRNPISWSSKKHKIVHRSSTEAEYRVVANALAELLWVKNLLLEMKLPIKDTPTIYCDNIGVTYLSENPGLHSRMKHVEVDFHFVRNHVQQKGVQV
ncbi:putative mitochondrial protein, partial [Nicotiana attenuata]